MRLDEDAAPIDLVATLASDPTILTAEHSTRSAVACFSAERETGQSVLSVRFLKSRLFRASTSAYCKAQLGKFACILRLPT